jgi:hypothetical protein
VVILSATPVELDWLFWYWNVPRAPGVGTSFQVFPRKISKGEVLRLDLLTEGRPRLSPPQNPLLNVNVIDEDRWSRRRPLIGAVMGLTGFACLVAAGVITLVDPHRSHAGRETVAFVGGALLLGSYAFDSGSGVGRDRASFELAWDRAGTGRIRRSQHHTAERYRPE